MDLERAYSLVLRVQRERLFRSLQGQLPSSPLSSTHMRPHAAPCCAVLCRACCSRSPPTGGRCTLWCVLGPSGSARCTCASSPPWIRAGTASWMQVGLTILLFHCWAGLFESLHLSPAQPACIAHLQWRTAQHHQRWAWHWYSFECSFQISACALHLEVAPGLWMERRPDHT
jgi:hypothetical protein